MAAPAEFRDNFTAEPFPTGQSNIHNRIFIATDLFYDLLITAGVRNNVPALAVLLKENFDSVNEIMNVSCHQLEKRFGISTELAVNIKIIVAVLMKHREYRKNPLKVSENQSIESIIKLLEMEIAHLTEEAFAYVFKSISGEFSKVYLNTREQEFSSPIVISEVIRNAILEDACEIYCAHNHPSGNEPSEQDYYAAQVLRCRLDAYSVKLEKFYLFTPDSSGKSVKNNPFGCVCKNLLDTSG